MNWTRIFQAIKRFIIWIFAVLLPAVCRAIWRFIVWAFPRIFRVIRLFFRESIKILKEILTNRKAVKTIGIFIIILAGLVTYHAIQEEPDFEIQMAMLVPLSIVLFGIVGITLVLSRRT